MYDRIIKKSNGNSKNKQNVVHSTQEAITKRVTSDDDDMEIVIVSDTVRQRRSRTPSSSTNPQNPESTESTEKTVLPDLLPKTFHLVESNPLFLQINSPNGLSLGQSMDEPDRAQQFSVVEIRESNLMEPKKLVNTFTKPNEMEISENLGEVLNSCSILESVNYLQPCDVETVHIIDATSEPSDTDTCCSTPNLDERPQSNATSTDGSESEEYETGEPSSLVDKIVISKERISFDERSIAKDRDNSMDKPGKPANPQRKKLTPSLKEILSADRDSFYSADKEVFDEPLTFSDDDDDDAPAEKIDRHTVLIQP